MRDAQTYLEIVRSSSKLKQGLLESWMNENVHVQFGGGLLEKCLLG